MEKSREYQKSRTRSDSANINEVINSINKEIPMPGYNDEPNKSQSLNPQK